MQTENTLSNPPTAMWFGLQPDVQEGTTVIASWGARAILVQHGSQQFVDLVPGRGQSTPNPPPAFKKWLDTKFTNWLNPRPRQRSPKIGYIDRGGDEVVTLSDGAFRAKACANRSWGYLYICAWMIEPTADAKE